MKIAIVGGGFTGLTAAYELTKAGHSVTVFEKEKSLGGLAWGFKPAHRRVGENSQAGEWDWYLEGGYHHWFTNDHEILELIGELGLRDKLIIKRPITANYYKGKIYPFDSPAHLFTFPYLSLFDKLRTAGLLAFCKVNPFWNLLEAVTAKDFFITIGGIQAWDVLWGPLMYGKFGEYADSVPASWLWARIKKRTQSLMYIEGGFHTVVVALEKSILKHGGKIITGKTLNSTPEGYDRVLLTIPSPVAAKLIPGILTPRVSHLHAQTLIVETDKPILQNIYWLNIADRSFPFLAVVAHTNFMDPSHYGGHHLTYVGNYLPQNHPYLSMTKEQLLKKFLPFMKRLSPTSRFTLYASYLFVGPFAQPVHQLHYSQLAPKLKTNVRGLYLANLDSVYPWDRGTNYAVKLGQKAANLIKQDVKESF